MGAEQIANMSGFNRYSEILDYHNVEAGVAQMENQQYLAQ